MANPFFPKKEIDWILSEFQQILEGNAPFSMGEKVTEFENIFSNYVGANYAVGTSSCSAALEIALRVAGVGSGDEVIIPSQTFIATGSAVVREGASPIFCDIDPRYYCMGLEQLKKKISKNTKAVILVHMAGMISPDALLIKVFCQKNNIILIEDAAHAIGASINGIFAGNIGDIGCFSFYPTKIITTSEGGMLVTSSREMFEKANSFRNRGRDMQAKREIYSRLGSNNRMTEIAALLGISQMRFLDIFLEKRRNIANVYDEYIQLSDLSNLVKPINVPADINHSYWRYLVTLDPLISREFIKEELLKDQIASDWAYYPPVHLQPYFIENYKTFRGLCPVSEDILERNICLPINPTMSQDDSLFVISRFIDAVKKSL